VDESTTLPSIRGYSSPRQDLAKSRCNWPNGHEPHRTDLAKILTRSGAIEQPNLFSIADVSGEGYINGNTISWGPIGLYLRSID